MLAEVEADRAILQGLAERVGARSNRVKEVAAWLGEKMAEVKFRRRVTGGFGTFEALETLALWRALAVVAASDARLHGVDFDHFAALAQVEERRLEIARGALRADPE